MDDKAFSDLPAACYRIVERTDCPAKWVTFWLYEYAVQLEPQR